MHALGQLIHQGQLVDEFREDIDPTLAAFVIVAANMFFFQASPVMQHIPEIDFTGDSNAFSREVMDLLVNGLRQKGGV